MKNLFTEHPRSIGESYWQHLLFACYIGALLLITGCIFIIHAIFPFILIKTGSQLLFKIVCDFINRMPNIDHPGIKALTALIQQKTQSPSTK